MGKKIQGCHSFLAALDFLCPNYDSGRKIKDLNS